MRFGNIWLNCASVTTKPPVGGVVVSQLVGCQYQVLMVGSVPSLPLVPTLTSL
ncbi:hypothetical protein D3C71_1922330 [compost metagenome]